MQQRQLGEDGAEYHLPCLVNSSDRRNLCFSESPPQPPPAARRRASRLPKLMRRESIISTYRNELYQPKIVTFMKNGDRFFEGVKVNVSSKNFRHWEVLLAELSRSIDLPAGVRHIYTPETGRRITTLEQLQHQRAYVCASTEPFKKIVYARRKFPTWNSGPNVKQTSGTFPDLSKSMHSMDRKLFMHGPAVDTSVLRQSEGGMERKRKRGCVRKLSFATQSQEKQIPVIMSPDANNPANPLSPPPQDSSQFTVICSGPPPRKVVTVFLDRQQITSWEQARSLIGESLQSTNGCLRLYSVDGMEVESLSQLWASSRVLISARHGDQSIANFLQGDVIQSVQQQQCHTQHVAAREEKASSPELQPHLPSGSPATTDIGEQTVEQLKQELPLPRKEGGVDRTKADRGAGEKREKGEEEEEEEEEKGSGESERGQAGGYDQLEGVREGEGEKTGREDKLTLGQVATESTQADIVNSPTDARNDEQHSLSPLVQDVREIGMYPTNSGISLTEDGSFLGSGSPLTVAKAAVIQHLHRLGVHYEDEHGSTSGSECSNNVCLASTSKPSVLCPQTPHSNISYGSRHSLVEMNIPKENGFHGSVSMHSTSSSSQHSSQLKSRTVGIQTDLVGDKLSAVIEEDQQPSCLGRSQRKRRLTHPLFHRHTSVGSQPNIINSSVSHRQKDNYTLGPLVSKGKFAVVQECHHKMTRQQYSLRVVNKAGIFGHEDLIRQECEISRSLKHENLVQVVDGWETSDDICMVVEHIEGTDLFDAILHCQQFCEADVTRAMKQLSMALVYLHARKIVHRDIKLENIFVYRTGESDWSLKLGGMGLATTIAEPLSLICGTIFYMAPEMITETGYGTKLDVWAAGVICCTLLSGIMPFGSNSKKATMSNIKRGNYSFLSPFWDKVSDEAKDFVSHLLVVSPNERYMATQMLQHPWLAMERWEVSNRSKELSSALIDHLVNKSASTKNAALPTLIVTALDKRKGLPHTILNKNTHKVNSNHV